MRGAPGRPGALASSAHPMATASLRPVIALRVVAVTTVVVMLVVAHRTGVLGRFADPAGARQALIDLGPWGYVAFVGAFALLQPFALPGSVFVFAAPLVWPWPVAFALSMTGTMAASVVGFSFARFVARDLLAPRIPQRLRRYDDDLARHAFRTVFWLRLVLWMPQVLHAFLGVSRVPFWTHFWASLLGYALPLLAVSYFGERIVGLARAAAPSTWIAFAVAVIALGALWMAWRRRRAVPDGGGESVPPS